jgi:hypothetical protein
VRALGALLVSGLVIVIWIVTGRVAGFLPVAKEATWCLIFIAYLVIGVKFYVAEVLSSDGFQYAKGWTDISLTSFAAAISLSTGQVLNGTILFDAPARVLVLDNPKIDPTFAQANLGAFLMSGIALLMFLACFFSAKYHRNVKGGGLAAAAKKMMASSVCLIAGSFSCGCYFSMVYLKA